ncbi:transposase [Pseudomonas protegens]|uniref:transposase n=1 Tax=Pseudomonas protegens TaxID=380021 RepID=UPI0034D687DE
MLTLSNVMPETLSAESPETNLQTCIIHLIRNSPDPAARDKFHVTAKDRRLIYQALNTETAERAFNTFETEPWDKKYLTVLAAR